MPGVDSTPLCPSLKIYIQQEKRKKGRRVRIERKHHAGSTSRTVGNYPDMPPYTGIVAEYGAGVKFDPRKVALSFIPVERWGEGRAHDGTDARKPGGTHAR